MLPVVPEAAVLEAVAARRRHRACSAVLGIALFISALAAGGDSLAGMAAYVGSYPLIGWDVRRPPFWG
ncbi:MAG: hypothetical protein ACLSUW_01545 [Akkermansia sp.]